LNGQRLKLPGDPGIFLIDQGYRRLIPDLETYFGLFRDNEVVLDPHINEIPVGTPISHGACLAKANDGTATVWLVDNRQKRAIASLAIFGKYHFNENRIVFVPRVVIEAIPDGAGISS
jgi:hypothetical protein